MSTNIEPKEVAPLLDLAISNGIMDAQQAQDVQEEHVRSGKALHNLIVDMGYISEDDLLSMMAAYQGCEVINLSDLDIPQEVLRTLPASVARTYNMIPVLSTPGAITLAVATLVEPHVVDELMFVLTRDVSFVLAREAELSSRVSQYYGDESETVADMLNNIENDLDREATITEDDALDEKAIAEQAKAAPVVKYVGLVLYEAVTNRASDIHFEPYEKVFRIRYRVDGALYEMKPPSRRMALPIISRIKVMAGLNIAERRVPQDGRITVPVARRHIDLRVSCLPTQFGESVVLRVLDRSVVSLDLENLGLPENIFEQLTMDIEKPNGIIIVTGPTGSGKTTTLYSALRRINTIDQKLLTAEEPVEYEIDGIIQVQINPLTGNTFAKVLRAFLRHDPDVMMVGEIRDFETAEIAIQASLTGHLVFSTLHTNDAAGAVTRLIDMDVQPYLISSSLEAVLGQRLVRTICANCKEPLEPDDETLIRLELTREQINSRPFYYGRGCNLCNNTGYKGRKGLFEYLRVSEPIREMINERKPTLFIKAKAREMGMRTMREDGIRNILDGYTTSTEVLRYT
ncbi:MAG: GspE/PulE family protein [Kiritimatiellia bacterium]